MHGKQSTLGLLLLLTAACSRAPAATKETPAPESAQSTASITATAAPATPAPPATTPAPSARIGQPAPAFTLQGIDGKAVSLADFKGKTVVLEWFNPACPFVNASHTKGSLVGAAERAQKSGAIWLAINSGAPGKQGHGAEVNQAGLAKYGLSHPILLDEDGSVGHAYGAKKTPHLFVIDASGTLVYAGAVDNSPDAEGESPEGGQLVRYVEQALSEIAAGKPVSVPETKPYGCSVKYKS